MVLRRVLTCEQDDTRISPFWMGLEASSELWTLHIGQVHVRNHDARLPLIGALKGVGSAISQIDRAAPREEDRAQMSKHRDVIDEKYARRC